MSPKAMTTPEPYANSAERRILLAGNGHGTIAVLRGLTASGLLPDLCSEDPEVIALGTEYAAQNISVIDSWPSLAQGLVITAGYKPIIPAKVISEARILNIHYSLLPRYRGLHSVVWAMLNGEREVGVSVHVMDELVDNGPIVWQARVAVEQKTSWDLMLELDALIAQNVGTVVLDYLSGRTVPWLQDFCEATFVGRRNQEDCRINWTWSAAYLERFLRALVPPYPRPFFEFKGRRYQVVRGEVVHRYYHEVPGRVVYRDKSSVWVKLADGLLRLYDLEHAGSTCSALDIFPTAGSRL